MSAELALTAGIIGGSLLLGIVTYPAIQKGAFAYTNARSKAAHTRLFSDQVFSSFTTESYKEILYLVEKQGYKDFLEVIDSDFREEFVQQKLRLETLSSLRKVKHYVPRRYKAFFEWLEIKTEVYFVITVLRSKVNPHYDRHLLDLLLVENNHFKKRDIEKLSSLSLDDFLVKLKKTPFYEVVSEFTSELKNGHISKCDAALNAWYYKKLLQLSRFDSHLVDYVKLQIDHYNIKRALAHKDSKPILGGSLSDIKLNYINSAESYADISKILEDTLFGAQVASADSTISFVNGLYKTQKVFADKMMKLSGLSICSTIGYVIHKDIGMRNLRILLKLKTANFSPEKIKSALI